MGKKKKSLRGSRSAVVHKVEEWTAVGTRKKLTVIVCGFPMGGMNVSVSDDWQAVTCKRCLRAGGLSGLKVKALKDRVRS